MCSAMEDCSPKQWQSARHTQNIPREQPASQQSNPYSRRKLPSAVHIFFQQASQQNQWFNQVYRLVFHQHERRLHIFQPVKFMCNELFGMNTAGLNQAGQFLRTQSALHLCCTIFPIRSFFAQCDIIKYPPSVWYYQYISFATY